MVWVHNLPNTKLLDDLGLSMPSTYEELVAMLTNYNQFQKLFRNGIALVVFNILVNFLNCFIKL